MRIPTVGVSLMILLLGSAVPATSAQQPATPPAAAGDAKPAFSQEELDQMFAPLALYPDDLLSQILMACTYPLEIVQANRWVKNNSNLKGDALAAALEKQTWDPSVKSLTNVPKVLSMLDDDLDRTQKIGDAFLGQGEQVMATIQKLRGKAKDSGNLKSNENQNVKVEESAGTQVIVIESSDPEVIYVPTYSPTVVYGSWWYPSYPPYVWNPYPLGGFGVGVACGLAWGYAWGHVDWGHGDINIDIDRNTNINNKIDRSKYKNEFNNRAGGTGGKGQWKHDASHRGSTPYRDNQTAQKFGGQSRTQAAQSREAYRGRTEAGLSGGAGNRAGGNVGNNSGANRQGSGSAANRGAMNDMNRGQAAQRDSSRGKSSRSGSSGSRPSGGGGRSGGGRGGGGRGGGGRR